MFKRFLVWVASCASLDYQKDAGEPKFWCHQLTNQLDAILYGKAKILEDSYKRGIHISNLLRVSWFSTIFKCLKNMRKPKEIANLKYILGDCVFWRFNPNDNPSIMEPNSCAL